MNNEIVLKDIIYSNELILAKINDYAQKLNEIYKKQELIIITVLNGAVFFAIHLIKKLTMEINMDFVAVSSYSKNKKKTTSRFYKELKINIANKNVLIVEDIVDSGRTVNSVHAFLQKMQPKNIRVCSLVLADKERNQQNNNFPIDGLLKLNNNLWIVGFGIDFEEKYRNLPNIYSIQWSKSKELIKIK